MTKYNQVKIQQLQQQQQQQIINNNNQTNNNNNNNNNNTAISTTTTTRITKQFALTTTTTTTTQKITRTPQKITLFPFGFLLLLFLKSSILIDPCLAYNNSNNNNNNNNNNQVMRAWNCHGKNQKDLVQKLVQAGIVKQPAVQQVMELIDRRNYNFQYNNNNNSNKNNNDASSSSLSSQEDENYDSYKDAPQTIGLGQTISAPHMHAYVLEEIYPYLMQSYNKHNNNNDDDDIRILDVGCGSGYLTAAFGRWLQPKAFYANNNNNNNNNPNDNTSSSSSSSSCLDYGSILFPNRKNSSGSSSSSSTTTTTTKVFGIDVHPELIELTRTNIQRQDGDLLLSSSATLSSSSSENNHHNNNNPMIELCLRDGWKGWPEHAPYDVIHVGAAASELPKLLIQQLKVGGICIIPIGGNGWGEEQKLYKIVRIASSSSSSSSSSTSTSQEWTTTSTFNPKDYEITVLLGVRYVPLVQHPEL